MSQVAHMSRARTAGLSTNPPQTGMTSPVSLCEFVCLYICRECVLVITMPERIIPWGSLPHISKCYLCLLTFTVSGWFSYKKNLSKHQSLTARPPQSKWEKRGVDKKLSLTQLLLCAQRNELNELQRVVRPALSAHFFFFCSLIKENNVILSIVTAVTL